MQDNSPLVDELELEAEELSNSPLAAVAELPAEVFYGGAAGAGVLALLMFLFGSKKIGVLFGLVAAVAALYGQQRQAEEMDAFDELEALPAE